MPTCAEHAETFWTLVTSAAHWELELFIMVVFDGIVGAIALPFLKRHWAHHVAHDKAHPETDVDVKCTFPGCVNPFPANGPGHCHVLPAPDCAACFLEKHGGEVNPTGAGAPHTCGRKGVARGPSVETDECSECEDYRIHGAGACPIHGGP